MLIGKDYKIESDNLNVILYERKTSKKGGNDYWIAISFFSSIKNALKSLADMKLRETKLKDMQTIARGQDEIYQLIDSLKLR